MNRIRNVNLSAPRRLMWLLLAPLLAAAPVQGPAAPLPWAPSDGATLSAGAFVGPAIPGATFTSGLGVADAGPAPRTPGGSADPRIISEPGASAPLRITAAERACLGFAREIRRSHAVIPTTCGNPPPAPAV